LIPFLVLATSVLGWLLAAGSQSTLFGQGAAATAPLLGALPEPIYWKQHLFLIPYQWGSAAEPGAARAVWLFVSKDRGASWQKISEAKPDVKAFNYRAEGDGEFWFAVRTFDKLGRSWPQGPYQPELRVIVDTTLPRITEVRAQGSENGAVAIQAQAADANLNPSSWKFEWQADPAGPWQPVMLQSAAQGTAGAPLGVGNTQSSLLAAPGSLLQAAWQPPAGARPVAIRGIVSDWAGNSATYQTRIESAALSSGPLLTSPIASPPAAPVHTAVAPFASLPVTTAGPQLNVPPAALLPQISGSTQAALTAATPQAAVPPATQPWPADNMARAPFRLWTGGTVQQDDGVTAYGSPSFFGTPPLPLGEGRGEGALPANRGPSPSPLPKGEGMETASNLEPPRVGAKYVGMAQTSTDAATIVAPPPPSTTRFATLEPYREPWATSSTTTSLGTSPLAESAEQNGIVPHPDSASPPKLVGSRTFALEYDLDDAGRGVTLVELWGTRDGGQSWRRYAQDDDNRSPLIVTVDEEGVYGFRIVIQVAGGTPAEPPRAGEAPELWVSVDLKRPVVELTAIERGQGNFADHLHLYWRAVDNNLEPRPIALFYSSRPSGPWSAIATNLENTGEYAWRVERYVPSRFHLRIEARDTAGNLSAFQTRDPVEFTPPSFAGRLRTAQPIGPTANESNDSYR
jgi:hypothetical protein